MNKATVERVAQNFDKYAREFSVPILLENSPLYFRMPTSTMSQTEFIGEICKTTPVGLLLDLAHFYITANNFKFDPMTEIDRLPLERVVEIHISGVDVQSGGMWDNHTARAPRLLFDLLKRVLRRAKLKAITLEYNWSARFSEEMLLAELSITRDTLAA
jgi:uncharacterized protein (UPF0276 family)